MSLLNKIPGLSRHRTEVPPKRYEADRADHIIRSEHAVLEACYPAGAQEWIRDNRPDLMAQILKLRREMDQAFIEAEMDKAEVLSKKLSSQWRRAFTVYRMRPPVIETQKQGGLF